MLCIWSWFIFSIQLPSIAAVVVVTVLCIIGPFAYHQPVLCIGPLSYQQPVLIASTPMPGNCVFNLLWMQDSKFCDWLMPCASDVHRAHCKYCKRDFTVTTMGITAGNSHLKSNKHKKLANIINQNASIKQSYASVSDQPKASSATSCVTESVRTTCDSYTTKKWCTMFRNLVGVKVGS